MEGGDPVKKKDQANGDCVHPKKKKEFKIDWNKTLKVPEKWDKKRKHDEIKLS